MGTETKQPAKTYLDKEKDLIQAIQTTDVFKSKDQALGMISDTLANIPDYVNTVVNYTTQMPIIYARYEGEDLRDRVTTLDRRRKTAHDAAIASIGIMNRISERLGLEPFAEVDTSNRHAVADFCGKYVNETYNNAIGGTMDEVVKTAEQARETGKDSEYDPKKIKSRLQDLDSKFGHIQSGPSGADVEYH